MINSMTGYGNADGRLSGVTYLVEISTVNNRYFKPTIRLPETLGFLESDVEKELRREVSRGTANYTLRQKGAPAEALFDINEKALATLLKRLGKISPSGAVLNVWESSTSTRHRNAPAAGRASVITAGIATVI